MPQMAIGDKPYVVVSGLPGSGKSVLARRLAPLLNLPVIDKDDILERLFEAKGVRDAASRRALSRESDEILRQEALNSEGAVLVSFWHLADMDHDSGTPTEWLRPLSSRVVTLHCICPPEIAADRFLARQRHPGHRDENRSKEDILASIRAISQLGPLAIAPGIEVDTSRAEPDVEPIARETIRLMNIRCTS